MIATVPAISRARAEICRGLMGSFSRKKAKKVTNTGLQLNSTAATEDPAYRTDMWRMGILRAMPSRPSRAKRAMLRPSRRFPQRFRVRRARGSRIRKPTEKRHRVSCMELICPAIYRRTTS